MSLNRRHFVVLITFAFYSSRNCEPEFGKFFKGENIENITITGLKLCIRECLYLSGYCKSINYNKESLLCRLNADGGKESLVTLQTNSDYIYSPVHVDDHQELAGPCVITPCISGFYKCVPLKHGRKCLPFCPSGFFKASNSCVPCPQGSFNNKYDAHTCTNCTTGHYQDKEQSKSCNECPAGTYQSDEGAATCIPCPAGSYSGSSASTKCNTCKTGEFQNQPGRTKCLNCVGTVGADKDSCGDINIAPFKSAIQLSTDDGQGPELAVDRNRTTCARTLNADSQYWRLDLGVNYNISRLVIVIDETSDNRDQHIYVSVGPEIDDVTSCGTYRGEERHNSEISLNCKSVLTGRYVSVQQSGQPAGYRLILCEVEVYGMPLLAP